ncbi:MAG: tRNA pseudouridine(38-40) synthase TruA [Propionibacteriaceae bacterium]|nr:tRNA pseudouridine(38-40) synthase TruA [Propionibacteriaceae bacterium]
MRVRLDISYAGAAFHGWATQRGLRTVQGELETWLARLLRCDAVALTVAGRTDAGVHARGQVAHFDLPEEFSVSDFEELELVRRLDRVLPSDVVVRKISLAPPGFDARFSAIWRRYVYRLADGTFDPLAAGYVAKVISPVDVTLLNQVSGVLLGLHDFVAFCKYRSGATAIRTLQRVSAERVGEIIELTVQADAFAHSMVRSLTGALLQVAAGRRDESWLKALLDRSDRCGEIPVMPAKGLTLEAVGYPPDCELEQRATQARMLRELN